jgi:hypothetical protein
VREDLIGNDEGRESEGGRFRKGPIGAGRVDKRGSGGV